MDINTICDEVRVLTEDAVPLAENSGDEQLSNAATICMRVRSPKLCVSTAPF